MTHPSKGWHQKFVVGFRPEVRARQGVMLGIRQPLDGPVFEKLEDARNWYGLQQTRLTEIGYKRSRGQLVVAPV